MSSSTPRHLRVVSCLYITNTALCLKRFSVVFIKQTGGNDDSVEDYFLWQFDIFLNLKLNTLTNCWTAPHLAVCDSHHDVQSSILTVDQFEVFILHEGTLGTDTSSVKGTYHCFSFNSNRCTSQTDIQRQTGRQVDRRSPGPSCGSGSSGPRRPPAQLSCSAPQVCNTWTVWSDPAGSPSAWTLSLSD